MGEAWLQLIQVYRQIESWAFLHKNNVKQEKQFIMARSAAEAEFSCQQSPNAMWKEMEGLRRKLSNLPNRKPANKHVKSSCKSIEPTETKPTPPPLHFPFLQQTNKQNGGTVIVKCTRRNIIIELASASIHRPVPFISTIYKRQQRRENGREEMYFAIM